MKESKKDKKPLPWWRRILLGLIVLAIALIGVTMLAGYFFKRQLGSEITKISKAGEPIRFSDLEVSQLPNNSSEDAVGYYVDAMMSLSPERIANFSNANAFYRQNILSLTLEQFPSDMREQLSQSISNFQPALMRFDKGATLPLYNFNLGIKQGRDVCIKRLGHIQVSTYLLSLRTLNLFLEGKEDVAAQSIINMLKFARVFETYPIMFLQPHRGLLIGLACEDIYLLLERGKISEEILAKLQQMVSESIHENDLERMFFAERAYQIEVGRNLFSQDIVSKLLASDIPDIPERINLPTTSRGRLKLRYLARQFFQDMSKLIKSSRKPWPAPFEVIEGDASQPPSQKARLLTNAGFSVNIVAEILAAVRNTATAIAIKRYYLSEGKLPDRLENLLGKYIDIIPVDPFTGKSLIYHQKEESFIIYSAGPNRKDDGGMILLTSDGKKPLDRGFRLHTKKQ